MIADLCCCTAGSVLVHLTDTIIIGRHVLPSNCRQRDRHTDTSDTQRHRQNRRHHHHQQEQRHHHSVLDTCARARLLHFLRRRRVSMVHHASPTAPQKRLLLPWSLVAEVLIGAVRKVGGGYWPPLSVQQLMCRYVPSRTKPEIRY